MTGNIVWLASFPKSGNTWFRAFYVSLLGVREDEFDINSLHIDAIASSRNLFDHFTGLDSSNLLPQEIAALRPTFHEMMSMKAQKQLLVKVHDAYTFLPDGTPLFPPNATFGTIYIIRNPLDVVPSSANHFYCEMDKAVEWLNNENTITRNKKHRDGLGTQLDQRLLDWSSHVLSWVDSTEMNVHVMRYEDMKHAPLESFSKAISFLGLNKSTAEISAAMENVSFENLQKQEREKGFRERPPKTKSFFRKGRTGSWRESLTDKQVQRVVEKHSEVMRRFGYLTEGGEIIY